ncbi:ZIP family metal transporter [Candidatus Woesebacteria bacterium]|nr:ZIP family metal transporter [Candidatus Woesebacteria bacterium]MCD8506880.1 ZIP family metal transporter [Candidatus Woesebacteria bacterium]MCD8527500.1 ZIP family metal transporter [Candidatus Woesebacteria bacterium]MCD8546241.1 ZIP family metal transporter [Candidatus Woesebacteria bacterium]
MQNIFPLLIASGTISAIAFLSAGLLSLFPKKLSQSVPWLVALAAGTLLSSTFLHLIPESLELLPASTTLGWTLASFVSFLILERVFRWHHCHGHDCDNHRSVGYMNLIGDGVHNFIDGMVLAAAFSVSPALGLSTTIAVAAHEFPQEIGDFGILIHSGFSRGAALLANFGVACMAITGALAGVLLSQYTDALSTYLIPIAAGSFLYIATVDLIPEIHHRLKGWQTVGLLSMFLLGLAILPVSEIGLQQLGIEVAHTHAHSETEHTHDHSEEYATDTHEEHDESTAEIDSHEHEAEHENEDDHDHEHENDHALPDTE